MKRKYVIVIRRNNTILYTFGPYDTKKAAQKAVGERTKQECMEGDRYDYDKRCGYVFREGHILKRIDLVRMILPN